MVTKIRLLRERKGVQALISAGAGYPLPIRVLTTLLLQNLYTDMLSYICKREPNSSTPYRFFTIVHFLIYFVKMLDLDTTFSCFLKLVQSSNPIIYIRVSGEKSSESTTVKHIYKHQVCSSLVGGSGWDIMACFKISELCQCSCQWITVSNEPCPVFICKVFA